ncbi:MAG TPA: orotidine-5'-phosphate decarboxylase, partial [Gemmatimonadaceae bacterium]|nr:orotidine-5'-phosphate decarboxylase [Gemmatimonadaceae bacterium]
ALDVPTQDAALALVRTLGDQCRFYKIGLELFAAEGPRVVRAVRDAGADVFLDLKFHDIPNTVRGAVRSAAALGVRLMTVHAAGGVAMLQAAQDGAAGTGCELLGVTVLTSLDAPSLAAAWGRDRVDVRVEVLRLAGLAAEAGLHGVVCSGHEAAEVRLAYGGRLATLVPGVRLAGDGAQDQARVVTPRAAALAGARYVILGRTVTAAADPKAAMVRVAEDLAGAVSGRPD